MKTTLRAVPTFASPDGKTVVQFFPVTDRVLRVSSTHRVIINGTAVDWLGAGFKPSAKTAQFFLAKHQETK